MATLDVVGATADSVNTQLQPRPSCDRDPRVLFDAGRGSGRHQLDSSGIHTNLNWTEHSALQWVETTNMSLSH